METQAEIPVSSLAMAWREAACAPGNRGPAAARASSVAPSLAFPSFASSPQCWGLNPVHVLTLYKPVVLSITP